jgi:hypothetical protein
MRYQFCAGAIALALLSGVGTAAAQSNSGSMTGSMSGSSSSQSNLTPSQQQSVKQGLASQPTDSAPSGYQGQVGAQLPSSVNPHAMPNNVASQVPAAKTLLFVKLQDRVLLIDPANKTIAEIIPSSDTTGSSGSNSSSGSSGSSGSSSSGGSSSGNQQ